jgi:hypothetical protein
MKMTAELLRDEDCCELCDIRTPHKHFLDEHGELEDRTEPWQPSEMSVEDFLEGIERP